MTRANLEIDRCRCEQPIRLSTSACCQACCGNLPLMTPREQLRLSFKVSWMKVSVMVANVLVGVYLTDTQEWVPLSDFECLTEAEKAVVFSELQQLNRA